MDDRFEIAHNTLYQEIIKLKPSGTNGFEDLIRDLLERFLGRTIYLMKSGSQGGGDCYTQPGTSGLSVVCECKRYKQDTKLPADELIAKLDDAADTYRDIDLWILATSKEISAQVVAQLQTKADRVGVGLIILDWSQDDSRLSYLGALAAEYSEVLNKYSISLNNGIYNSIKLHPLYEAKLLELKQLLVSPELSYSYSRSRAIEYLNESFVNIDKALVRLGCHGNIAAKDVRYIERVHVTNALNKWWENDSQCYALVHGLEGRGKSWSVFHWIYKKYESLPLVLIIPAQKISKDSLLNIISDALNKITTDTTNKDDQFHCKKVSRFISNSQSCKSLLLVFDGLNQNYTLIKEYESLFLEVFANGWENKVKIIVTARTSFLKKVNWFPKLNGEDENRIFKINVKDFSSDEQNKLIRQNNLNKSDFEPAIINLVKVPRYATLIIKHSDELKGIQECSIEHIFLLDWKDRIQKSSYASSVSVEDFIKVVIKLARKFKPKKKTSKKVGFKKLKNVATGSLNLSEKELIPFIDELSSETFFNEVPYSDIFSLKPEWATTILALVLKSELEQSDTKNETLAKYIEPMKGADQVSEIMLSTILLFLMDSVRKNKDSLILLFDELFKLQNISYQSQNRLYLLPTKDIDFYLEQFDLLLLNNPNSYYVSDMLTEALLSSIKKDIKDSILNFSIDKINEWLGTILVIKNSRFYEDVKTIKSNIAKNFTYKQSSKSDYICSLKISESRTYQPDDFKIASQLFKYGNVGDYKGIINWFLSYAIYPYLGGEDLMAWLLKWNISDTVLSSIVKRIKELNTVTLETKHKMVNYLIEFSGAEGYKEFQIKKDRVEKNIVPHVEVNFLDPNCSLDEHLQKQISQEVESLDILNVKIDPYPNVIGNKYLELRNALLRTNLDMVIKIEKHIYSSGAKDSFEKRSNIFDRLISNYLILKDLDQGYCDAENLIDNPLLKTELHEFQCQALLSVYFSRFSFKEQIVNLINLDKRLSIAPTLINVIDKDNFDRAFFMAKLFSIKNDFQRVNLLTIGLGLDIKKILDDEEYFFLSYCTSDHQMLRELTNEWIARFGNYKLINRCARLISDSSLTNEQKEKYRTSEILMRITDLDLIKETKFWTFKYMPIFIFNRKFKESDISDFTNYIIKFIDDKIQRKKSFDYSELSKGRPIGKICKAVFGRVIKANPEIGYKLKEFSESDVYFSAFETHPITFLISSYWEINPKEAELIWFNFKRKLDSSKSSCSEFLLVPLKAKADYEKSFKYLYDKLDTDLKLRDFVDDCVLYKKTTYLKQMVKKSLMSDLIAERAKALVIMGFLAPNKSNDLLWKCNDIECISTGWLLNVKNEAQKRYIKGKWAIHWFGKFQRADSPEDTWRYYQLFQECFDLRSHRILNQKWSSIQKELGNMQLSYFYMQANNRKTIREKQKGKLKETFGFTKIRRELSPWKVYS